MSAVFRNDAFLFLIIILVSFFASWYFGFIAINPIDNFTNYNSGYLVLEGKIPFRDYWVTTGPFLDFIQFFIFKISGVNWYGYIFHSALLNSLFCCLIFYTFRRLNLNKYLSLIYSLATGITLYSQLGTPFVDHHSSIFGITSLLLFILAINKGNNLYWALIPFFITIGFFSKQTPASYFAIIIFVYSLYFFFSRKDFQSFIVIFFSSISILMLLSFLFLILDIKFLDFYHQYVKFASSVGEARLSSDSFLKPFNFSRYFLKFKWLHLSYIPLIYVVFKSVSLDKAYLKSPDFISISLLILSSYILIIHQLLTLNVKFIYFYIPILCGFCNIYLIKSSFPKKKAINQINILVLIIACSYYFTNYILKQKFQLFCNYKIIQETVTQTDIIDNNTSFNWISCLNNNPKKEVENIKKILKFLNSEIDKDDNYVLITDYQFLNSRLQNNNQVQINKWYHPGVSYPLVNNIQFSYYKSFFFEKIKLNKIKFLIFVYPSHFRLENQLYYESMLENCDYKKLSQFDGLLVSLNIEKCY